MNTKNFMTAGTEISEMIEKVSQVNTKIANILAEACVNRAKTGNVSNSLRTDIANTIKTLPAEQQADILLNLSVILTKQLTLKPYSKSESLIEDDGPVRKTRNDIFANRRY